MTTTKTQAKSTTDRDQVAALIGVRAGTLPQGPCTVENAPLRFEYADPYHDIVPSTLDATAYTWRDAQNNKIAEIKVPADKDASLRYQVSTYNAAGGITRREDVKNGAALSNVISYDDDGKVYMARYGTSFGYDEQAERIQKFDRAGKLHSLDGYADCVKSEGFTFDSHYYIHGQEYGEKEYRRNPEFTKNKSLGAVFGRLAARVSGVFSRGDHAKREASAPAAVMTRPALQL